MPFLPDILPRIVVGISVRLGQVAVTGPSGLIAEARATRCEPFSPNRLTPASCDSGFRPGTMVAGAREQAASCDAFVLSRRRPAPDAPPIRTSSASTPPEATSRGPSFPSLSSIWTLAEVALLAIMTFCCRPGSRCMELKSIPGTRVLGKSQFETPGYGRNPGKMRYIPLDTEAGYRSQCHSLSTSFSLH